MSNSEEAASLRARLANLPENPIPTWKQFINNLSEWLPLNGDQPFTFTSGVKSEPYAVYDDDDNETWTKETYSIDFEFDGSALTLIVNQGDNDDNWDVIVAGGEEQYEFIYTNFISPQNYFVSWAHYHLWCAENGGVDPLKAYYKLEDSTVESHLKTAKSMIEYAEY